MGEKNDYKPKQKKAKGRKKGKEGKKKEKKGRTRRIKEKRERKRGKRKEIGKKKEKDGFWLTQENKQNLFWGKKSYFFPRGKEYHIFSRWKFANLNKKLFKNGSILV